MGGIFTDFSNDLQGCVVPEVVESKRKTAKSSEETFKVIDGKLCMTINNKEFKVNVPASLFIKDVAVHPSGERVHCPRGQKFEYLASGVLKKAFSQERARERNALVRFLLQINEAIEKQGSIRTNAYVETVYGLKYLEWSGLKSEPKEFEDSLVW